MYIGNSIPTFRDNLAVPATRVKNLRFGLLEQKSTDLFYILVKAWNHNS
jgi:hypothetical protein